MRDTQGKNERERKSERDRLMDLLTFKIINI